MSNFVKRGIYQTFEDYVYDKTGKTMDQLDKFRSYYKINHLEDAAEVIMSGIKSGKRFGIYGDYDADGITSVSQFILLMKLFGGNAVYKIPKRFTDGYGINVNSMDDLGDVDILITVDNGIAAIDAIKKAIDRGMYVIIMDHHSVAVRDGEIVLPESNILIDPEALPDGNDFEYYCGAGLTYRLLEYMVKKYYQEISDKSAAKSTLMQAAAFAAIGTIADVVSLTEDNRRIVKLGLWAIEHEYATDGLNGLVKVFGIERLCSGDVAFKLAPALNAAGRLYDNGATQTAKLLLTSGEVNGLKAARKLKEINDQRKQLVEDAIQSVSVDPDAKINFIRCNGGPGIMGLIAGKITESTKKPTFAYSESNGICKGSARSDDEAQNNVKQILDSCQSLLLGYGGHPGAAGFSFAKENEAAIREALSKCTVVPHDTTDFYDLELQTDTATSTLRQMDKAEPFGKGMERPVFKIACDIDPSQQVVFMGADKSHVKFMLPGNVQAVGFRMAEKYINDGKPGALNLYGDLTWNYYKGNATPNLLIKEYEPA